MKCFLCGSEQPIPFDQVESFGFPLVYYQCQHCGLVFQSAEESQAADPQFYAETYRKIYQASEEPTQKDLWVQEKRAKHLLNLVKQHLEEKPIRILDIGASAGVFLNIFGNAFNAITVGVEPGDAYRTFAQGSGIEMYPTINQLIANTSDRFDLVSMVHVLEHLPDPVGTLVTIRERLLSDRGSLMVEVPNFYCHDSFELAHLACYSPHTLRQVIQQAGFEIFYQKRHGIPRSAVLNLYLTVLARPRPDKAVLRFVAPENGVLFKRNIGLLYRRLVQKILPHKAWLPLPNEGGSE